MVNNHHHRHRECEQQNGNEADAVFMCLCLLVSSTFFQLSLYHFEPIAPPQCQCFICCLEECQEEERAEAESRDRTQRQRAEATGSKRCCEILSLSFVLSPHTFFPPAPMEMLQFNRKPWQPLGAHLTEPGEGETMSRPLISLVPTSSTL